MLENDLHIVYLVVPLYAAMQWPNLDWMAYLDMWAGLAPDLKRVGELVGVEERFLVRYIPIFLLLGTMLSSCLLLVSIEWMILLTLIFNSSLCLNVCQGHERRC